MFSIRLSMIWLAATLIGAAQAGVAYGEQPTREAIVALSAQCLQAREAMDLVARFGTDFSGLDLHDVDFRGAHYVGLATNLRGADFSGANLQGAQFGASILDEANFRGADLDRASFVTARLTHADLTGAHLMATSFQECDFAHAHLAGVDFSQAKITGSRFPDADLSRAKLSGATNEYEARDFRGANLSGADLRGQMLRRANFHDALLNSADLSGCDLGQADFTGADLTDASLDNARIDAAIFDRARGLTDVDRRRLVGEARRWKFDAANRVTSFLNSPIFLVCLLLVSAITCLQRLLAPDRSEGDGAPASARAFQFHLATLIKIAIWVCVFLGLASWSLRGVYWLGMVSAAHLMFSELIVGRTSRRWIIGVLLAVLGYSLANLGFWASVLFINPFSLFNPLFVLLSILLGPLAVVVAIATSVAARPELRRRPPWPVLAGATIWMIGVGTANLLMIAEASASV